jgi:hypothetical protein
MREEILMASATVNISEKSNAILRELAEETGRTTQEILDAAVEEYRRKLFIERVNAGYAALRADPEAWAEFQAELHAWDSTLMDGLDPRERWTEDGRCLTPEQPGE